jgi:hypothetical protein
MKSLSVRLGVTLSVIGLIIFGNIEAWGVDWKIYSEHELAIYSYDTESLTRTSKNITRVWVKLVYTNKGVMDWVEKSGGRYKNLWYTIELDEINCQEKKSQTLKIILYSKEGTVLHSSSREGEWDYIIPGSIREVLYQAVCK